MSALSGSFDQEAETGETADSLAARFDEDWHRAERRFGVVILLRFQDETRCGKVRAWQDHAGLIQSS
jgi:hypothetical protein